MIYDLSQLIFNNVSQWPKFRPISMDLCIPDATSDGRVRHLALFSVFIQNAGKLWTRTVVWDEREMA
jgi:hypothetical protein